ncbi:hypothetical protein L484_001263 [Morus notabilis]|uniref:Uncharacterized protein n=1 Tax=Morus notabilis TaxID=981085 RepID=W9T1K9_9ROSA|nr:hypothetical protein L484_001263 [Morus notabilis]
MNEVCIWRVFLSKEFHQCKTPSIKELQNKEYSIHGKLHLKRTLNPINKKQNQQGALSERNSITKEFLRKKKLREMGALSEQEPIILNL